MGGISSGELLVFRVGIKPASSISQDQETCTFTGEPHVLSVKGRPDPCVLPRAPPLVEGMTAMVLMDAALRQRARTATACRTLGDLGHGSGTTARRLAEEPASKVAKG